jgi:hypothetical protein
MARSRMSRHESASGVSQFELGVSSSEQKRDPRNHTKSQELSRFVYFRGSSYTQGKLKIRQPKRPPSATVSVVVVFGNRQNLNHRSRKTSL